MLSLKVHIRSLSIWRGQAKAKQGWCPHEFRVRLPFPLPLPFGQITKYRPFNGQSFLFLSRHRHLLPDSEIVPMIAFFSSSHFFGRVFAHDTRTRHLSPSRLTLLKTMTNDKQSIRFMESGSGSEDRHTRILYRADVYCRNAMLERTSEECHRTCILSLFACKQARN